MSVSSSLCISSVYVRLPEGPSKIVGPRRAIQRFKTILNSHEDGPKSGNKKIRTEIRRKKLDMAKKGSQIGKSAAHVIEPQADELEVNLDHGALEDRTQFEEGAEESEGMSVSSPLNMSSVYIRLPEGPLKIVGPDRAIQRIDSILNSHEDGPKSGNKKIRTEIRRKKLDMAKKGSQIGESAAHVIEPQADELEVNLDQGTLEPRTQFEEGAEESEGMSVSSPLNISSAYIRLPEGPLKIVGPDRAIQRIESILNSHEDGPKTRNKKIRTEIRRKKLHMAKKGIQIGESAAYFIEPQADELEVNLDHCTLEPRTQFEEGAEEFEGNDYPFDELAAQFDEHADAGVNEAEGVSHNEERFKTVRTNQIITGDKKSYSQKAEKCCKKNCLRRFTAAEREVLASFHTSFAKKKSNVYLLSLLEIEPPKRIVGRYGIKRTTKYKYYYKVKIGKKHGTVCRRAFLILHNINIKRLIFLQFKLKEDLFNRELMAAVEYPFVRAEKQSKE